MVINCSQYYSQLCWFEDVNYTAWIQCSVYIYIRHIYIYKYIYIIDKNAILVSFVIDHPSTLASMSVVVCGYWDGTIMGAAEISGGVAEYPAFSQNDRLKREGFSQLNTLFMCYRVIGFQLTLFLIYIVMLLIYLGCGHVVRQIFQKSPAWYKLPATSILCLLATKKWDNPRNR